MKRKLLSILLIAVLVVTSLPFPTHAYDSVGTVVDGHTHSDEICGHEHEPSTAKDEHSHAEACGDCEEHAECSDCTNCDESADCEDCVDCTDCADCSTDEAPKAVNENKEDVNEDMAINALSADARGTDMEGYCPDCAATVYCHYTYMEYNETYHYKFVTCDNCGYNIDGGVANRERHDFVGDTCSECGYVDSCSHSSTYEDWVTDCEWQMVCDDCGEVTDSGVTHGPYEYGDWVVYSGTQHRRVVSCYYGDYSTYEYEDHGSTTTEWVTDCDWEETCDDCGALIDYGTVHGPYSYSDWSYYSSTQHRRTKSCDYGDYSTYEYASHSTTTKTETHSDTQHKVHQYCSDCKTNVTTTYESHSFTYGEWESYSDTQHRRTKSCSCGYSGYDYADHTLTYGDWEDDSDTEHSRSVSCSCGYSSTESGEHADSDNDGTCDSCTHTMTQFSVTVPATLSLVVSENGEVYAATNAEIKNNSSRAVEVTGIQVNAKNGWSFVPYGYDMADAKVDSRLIGISFGGAQTNATGTAEDLTLSGDWTIAKGGSLPLDYDANVSANSAAVTAESVMNVTFVVDWAS